MADTYANFRELARRERAGIDYRILARGALPSVTIVAAHGGGIEPGTSEVADAAAAEELGFYAFKGLKLRGNGELHITSTRFDEPVCLSLIERSQVVLTIHGEHGRPTVRWCSSAGCIKRCGVGSRRRCARADSMCGATPTQTSEDWTRATCATAGNRTKACSSNCRVRCGCRRSNHSRDRAARGRGQSSARSSPRCAVWC